MAEIFACEVFLCGIGKEKNSGIILKCVAQREKPLRKLTIKKHTRFGRFLMKGITIKLRKTFNFNIPTRESVRKMGK